MGSTVGVTMRKAAQATIDAGYTHFRLEQVQTGQGSQVGALVGTDDGNGFTTVTALHRPTSYEGVTVVMFHADEAGAKARSTPRMSCKNISERTKSGVAANLI